MLKRLMFLGAATVSQVALAAPAAQSPAVLFGTREAVESIDLSADGTHVVYLTPTAGASSVAMVSSLAGGKPAIVATASGKPDRLHWCRFVGSERLICRASAMLDVSGTLLPVTRLFAINVNGGDLKQLGQSLSFYDAGFRQYDGRILDWLPDDRDAVLMARAYIPEAGRIGTRLVRDKEGLGVDRIELKTMRTTPVEQPYKGASDYMTDGRGKVRIRQTYQRLAGASDSMVGENLTYSYRRKGSSAWEDFSTYNIITGQGMSPLAIDAEIDAAYALKKLNGRFALYRVKLDGSMATELVYANDKVDVDDVVRIGRGDRVIGVTFAEEARETVYFDPEYAALANSLSKALPNLPLVRFAGSNDDNSKLLIFAGSDTDPGRYYVYDRKGKQLNEIMLARPQLENVPLAKMKPVSYPAPDGVQVPGYLTLPPGREAKNLPTVVLPHGGPSARDEWGFDWLTQYLANQGYAVLQPNYRGSAGYGDAWLAENGFKGWRTSIGDISAGARWLASQGIADPNRIAIVGWSYGGYAALQSGATEPGLYKAIVAVAPVTDLGMVKREAKNYTNQALVERFIGSGPHVTEGSPLQNVAQISAPVLMFHGDRDINVEIEQARAMDRALRAKGKSSQLVEFEGLEHSLEDTGARIQMLERMGAFLNRAIGRPAGAAAGSK